jgi:HlyD family secretion protein
MGPVPSPDPPELSVLRINRQADSSRRRVLAWLSLAFLAVVLGGAAYLWLNPASRQAAARAAAPAFSAVPVEKVTALLLTEGQRLTLLSATGYVEAETRADVSPKITSRITEMTVTEGSRVKKGDVLARLDHTDLDAQLADATAEWENARADLERQKTLWGHGVASKSAYDAAVNLEASRRAKVRYVRALMDYTVLRAPFDGVVVAKRAHVGEAVSPYGQPGQGSQAGGAIVTLVDFASFYVGTDVNEANLARLSGKQPAEIVLDAYPDHVYHGTLKQIVPSADRQKGTVKVKVAIKDPDERILPDLSAKVSFTSESTEGREAKKHVEVPKSAVVARDGVSGVWLIASDRVSFRQVRVGRESDGALEILEGLKGGEELVAAASTPALSEGMRVKVRE